MGGVAVLSDDEVRIAIAVDVRADQGAGPIQTDGAKSSRGGNIGEAAISEIAQQHHFAGASGIAFAHSCEIDPTVIVDVDRGDSPTTNPLRRRNIDSFKSRSTDVFPEAHTGPAPMRERQIHQTVFVEVECNDARRRLRECRYSKVPTSGTPLRVDL